MTNYVVKLFTNADKTNIVAHTLNAEWFTISPSGCVLFWAKRMGIRDGILKAAFNANEWSLVGEAEEVPNNEY